MILLEIKYTKMKKIKRGVWIYQNKFLAKKLSPPPTQITFLKYNEKSIFWNAIFGDKTLKFLIN